MIPGMMQAIAQSMKSNAPMILPPNYGGPKFHGKPGKPGDKIRRRAAKGTLTLRHPGGLVSETFRDKARERNIERLKTRKRSNHV